MSISSVRDTFAIRHDERWMMLAAMLALGFFQYLMVAKFFPQFARYDLQQWDIFMENFHMSGFDPYTYNILTDCHSNYDPIRHPLLPIALYPLYLFNQGLWLITGANCCQILMGTVLWLANGYAFLWLYRTLAHAIGIGRRHALLLTAFFFGFAYVLLSTFVPDHFGLSQPLLMLTVYRAAFKMKHRETFSATESLLLFTTTAGITLSNGVSVFLIILITNGRTVLRTRYLLQAFVLPSVFLLGIAVASGRAVRGTNSGLASPVEQQTQWLKTSVSRTDIAIENFFGESLQLHRKHVLGDVLTCRPVIVRYSTPLQYIAEALILLLFIGGCIAGRRRKLLWTVLAVLGFNIVLHLVVGFGINEVYIMTAHWAFCIPVAIAFLLKPERPKTKMPTVLSLSVLTLYLWTYHSILLYNYLTWPVRIIQ